MKPVAIFPKPDIAENDIVQIKIDNGIYSKYVDMEVLSVIDTTSSMVPEKYHNMAVVQPFETFGSVRLVKITDCLPKDGLVVRTKRKTKQCPKCKCVGYETGTLGLKAPLFACYVCQWTIPDKWIPPPPPLPKIRKSRKSEKKPTTSKGYDALLE